MAISASHKGSDAHVDVLGLCHREVDAIRHVLLAHTRLHVQVTGVARSVQNPIHSAVLASLTEVVERACSVIVLRVCLVDVLDVSRLGGLATIVAKSVPRASVAREGVVLEVAAAHTAKNVVAIRTVVEAMSVRSAIEQSRDIVHVSLGRAAGAEANVSCAKGGCSVRAMAAVHCQADVVIAVSPQTVVECTSAVVEMVTVGLASVLGCRVGASHAARSVRPANQGSPVGEESASRRKRRVGVRPVVIPRIVVAGRSVQHAAGERVSVQKRGASGPIARSCVWSAVVDFNVCMGAVGVHDLSSDVLSAKPTLIARVVGCAQRVGAVVWDCAQNPCLLDSCVTTHAGHASLDCDARTTFAYDRRIDHRSIHRWNHLYRQ